jgi:septal ring factor EnvC (AmiA/AmiB activator)
LRKIRDSINQHIADANTESIARIQPESIRVETKLNESKEEFATLVQEVEEFQQNIGKLENPLKAIIRMEFELKRQKAKQQ